jgi:hypothetical protein
LWRLFPCSRLATENIVSENWTKKNGRRRYCRFLCSFAIVSL